MFTRPSRCHEFHQTENVVVGIDSGESFVEESLELVALKISQKSGELLQFLAVEIGFVLFSKIKKGTG